MTFEGSITEISSQLSQKIYFEADFCLGCSRKWMEKIQIIISFQIFYKFAFYSWKNWSWKYWNVSFFRNHRLPCCSFISLEWKPLKVGIKMIIFWTPGLPLGSIVIALVRLSVFLSVFNYLRDRSLVFAETLHEVRGQLSTKSDMAEILKKNLNPGIKGD